MSLESSFGGEDSQEYAADASQGCQVFENVTALFKILESSKGVRREIVRVDTIFLLNKNEYSERTWLISGKRP